MRILQFLLFIIWILLGCSNTTSDKSQKVSYDTSYVSIQKNKWTVTCSYLPNVIPFPYQEVIDSIQAYYNAKPKNHHLTSYGIDSVYHYESKNFDIEVTMANEAGFARRYPYMLAGRVRGASLLLLNNIKIGDPVDQFKNFLPESVMTEDAVYPVDSYISNLENLREIEYTDQWSIYRHRYIIENGRLAEVIIEF